MTITSSPASSLPRCTDAQAEVYGLWFMVYGLWFRGLYRIDARCLRARAYIQRGSRRAQVRTCKHARTHSARIRACTCLTHAQTTHTYMERSRTAPVLPCHPASKLPHTVRSRRAFQQTLSRRSSMMSLIAARVLATTETTVSSAASSLFSSAGVTMSVCTRQAAVTSAALPPDVLSSMCRRAATNCQFLGLITKETKAT